MCSECSTDFSEDFTTGNVLKVDFPAMSDINGTIKCANITNYLFEGNQQSFTVLIASAEYPGSVAASNVECVSDCEATVTIEDNAADRKLYYAFQQFIIRA